MAVDDLTHYMEAAARLRDLRAAVTSAFSYPRFLSVGSIDNTVEIRMDREKYEEIRAMLDTKAVSVARG
jgi:hypothetical protein